MAEELVDCMPTASADEWHCEGGSDLHYMLARLDEEAAEWGRTYMLAPLSSPRRRGVIDAHLLEVCGLIRIPEPTPQYLTYKASSLGTVLHDFAHPDPPTEAPGMLRLMYLRQALFLLPDGRMRAHPPTLSLLATSSTWHSPPPILRAASSGPHRPPIFQTPFVPAAH